jgi:hypothetical protein
MADVVVRMSGDEARLWRAQQKVIDQAVKYEQSVRKAGQAAGEAGRRGQQAARQATTGWKTDMLRRFAGTLSGVVGGLSVASAFRTVINLAREAHAEIEEVATSLQDAHDGVKRIWQVSESQEVYRGLTTKYKLAMAKEGMSREEAQNLAFTLKSFQEMEALPAVAKASRFMQSDTAAEFIARLRAPTAWGKGVASPDQALAGLVAGAFKSGFDVNVTAEWFARTASAFKAMGATPEEVLGVGAAISPAFTQGTLHATAMRRMEATLSKWRAGAIEEGDIKPEQAKGLIGTFQAMRTLDPEAYQAALRENVRFKAAATALQGAIPRAKAMTAEIGEQFRTGAMYREKVRTPPDLSLLQELKISEMQKELVLEPLAMKQNRLETTINQAKTLAAMTGRSYTGEKAWEKLLKAGAAYADIDPTQRLATQHLVDMIQEEKPYTFKQKIQRHLTRPPPSLAAEAETRLHEWDVKRVTPELTEVLRQVMEDFTTKNLEKQERAAAAMQEAAEGHKEAASYWRRAIERLTDVAGGRTLGNPAVDR